MLSQTVTLKTKSRSPKPNQFVPVIYPDKYGKIPTKVHVKLHLQMFFYLISTVLLIPWKLGQGNQI